MKIKDIQNYFKDDDPEDEIFFMYWSKDAFEAENMSDEEWGKVVEKLDYYSFDSFHYALVEAIDDQLGEIRRRVE